MLDASSSGVFQMRSIEERWDLIERIQKNNEDWEIDKGIEPAINYEHDYIESYVKTDYFNTFCSKVGLDSQLMIGFCKDFSSHVDSSNKNKDQHHKTFKESPIDINVADPILPAVIYEHPPFPARTKEHSFVTGTINKSGRTSKVFVVFSVMLVSIEDLSRTFLRLRDPSLIFSRTMFLL